MVGWRRGVSRWPAPTRADHEKFCQREGWRRARDARGRTGTHHITYEFDLPDGRTLRTRISHPPDRTDYGPRLWSHILRDQLQTDEAAFWACIQDGTPPGRGRQTVRAETLPSDLVYLLINRVGLSEAEISEMTKEEAIRRLNESWSAGADQ